MTLRNPWCVGLLISLSTFAAQAKKPHMMPVTPLTPAQAALIDKAMVNERVMVKELQKRIPMVQTYIQNLKPDAQLAAGPSIGQVHPEPRGFRQVLSGRRLP